MAMPLGGKSPPSSRCSLSNSPSVLSPSSSLESLVDEDEEAPSTANILGAITTSEAKWAFYISPGIA